jgi:hypothetical protein
MAASADTDQSPAQTRSVPDDHAPARDRPEQPQETLEQLSAPIAQSPNSLAWAPASSTLDDVLFSVD